VGFLVAGHDFCSECDVDNVRLFHGSGEPENRENKLVNIHSRLHLERNSWVVLFAYFIAAVRSTGLNPPTFVYMILFIYFFLFNIFAINMVLQYKGVGRWRDYLYGERFYIILSFVAKKILAWLVFVGVFAPF
jgi:hypothetical protein